MALTLTIDTPTVTFAGDSIVTVSVTAHAANGAGEYAASTFWTSMTQTDTAARLEAVNTLAAEIVEWKARMVKQQTADGLMPALKSAIEAKITGLGE